MCLRPVTLPWTHAVVKIEDYELCLGQRGSIQSVVRYVRHVRTASTMNLLDHGRSRGGSWLWRRISQVGDFLSAHTWIGEAELVGIMVLMVTH